MPWWQGLTYHGITVQQLFKNTGLLRN
jgi:hypothetical protein